MRIFFLELTPHVQLELDLADPLSVIRPAAERWEPELHGRLVLKLHGQGFRLGKG